jgi:lysozyme family protein
MSRFEECFKHVILAEGGYVNDPSDPGGRTQFGITQRDHPDLWLNGPPTIEQAQDRYEQQYWKAAGCDKLPPPFDLLVFDAAVNQGIFPAVTAVQKGLGVDADGRVGPRTIAACKAADKEKVALALAHRALRYAQTRGFDRYGIGWLKRTYLVAMEANNNSGD